MKSADEIKKYSCLGKVFILGEYTCMQGGPALVTTIGPEFELRGVQGGSGTLPFAEQSPAGILLRRFGEKVLNDFSLEWIDPYQTPIGVGSSSAQFLLTLRWLVDQGYIDSIGEGDELQSKRLLELYWETVGSTQGIRPSGVDVVAQALGGTARIEAFGFERLADNKFPGSTFMLAFTGSKMKTHEHLKELQQKGFPAAYKKAFQNLDTCVNGAVAAWKSRDEKTLGQLLNEYQQILFNEKISPKDFHEKVQEVQKWNGVIGAKGSGAQGGDCVLILCNSSKLAEISKQLQNNLGWSPYFFK